MQLESIDEDYSYLHSYSYLEFLICPNLLYKLISISEQQTIQNLWYSYFYHLQTLLNNQQITQELLIGKIGAVFKCLLIITEYYLPKCQQLIDLQVDSTLIPFILQQSQKTRHAYYLMQQYFLLKNESIDLKSLLEQAIKDPVTDPLKLDTLFLLAKDLFISNDVNRLQSVILLLKNQPQEGCSFYDIEKIDLIESVLVQEEALSPITDDEKDKPISKFTSYVESKSNQTNLYSNEFQNYTPTSYVSGLLDFGIQSGNKQAISEAKEYKERSYMADIIITINEYDTSKLISYQELDQYLKSTLSVIQLGNVIKILDYKTLGAAIVSKIEQTSNDEYQFEKQRDDNLLWQIIANSLFHILQLLFPTMIKPFNIENWLPLHKRSMSLSPLEDPRLEFWISSIHIQITLGLGLIYYEHLHIIQQKKMGQQPDRIDDINHTLIMLDEIFKKCEEDYQHDIIRSVIENMMAKPYLDTIQAILLKEGQKNQVQKFNTVLSILNEINPDYQCPMKKEYKIQLVNISFKREKEVQIYNFSQLKYSHDQLEFRYSKFYKKQVLFYFRQEEYKKCISKAIKYFTAYLTQPSLIKTIYQAEEQILYCMYQSFLRQKQYPEAIVMSQFLVEEDDQIPFKDLQLSEDICQMLFEPKLIEKLACGLRREKESASMLVKRIQDNDCYFLQDQELKMNIKEKYLTLFIGYLKKELFLSKLF